MKNDIIKTSKNKWLGIFWPSLYFLCIAAFFFWVGRGGIIIGVICTLFVLFILYISIKSYPKNFIEFTPDSISGFVDYSFHFPKESIQAVWFTGTRDFKILHIVENNTGHDIKCSVFDINQLDYKLRQFFPTEIYSDYSYLEIPVIQDWFYKEKQKFEELDRKLVVNVRGTYIFPAIFCLCLSILLILVFSAFNSSIPVKWFFLFVLIFFAGLILMFVPLDKLIVSYDSIKFIHFFKETEINWTTLTKISHSSGGYRIILYGMTAKISIPLSDNWFGKDKEMISDLFDFKCMDLKIVKEE